MFRTILIENPFEANGYIIQEGLTLFYIEVIVL